jgi:glycerophosphoryl diester phosphodiesterase
MPTRGVCAHRGGAFERPENTLAAFRHAGEVGVHQVEFDVRRTADGELVVIHDATVDRTTDGHGRVRDWKLADLRCLDAGRRGSGAENLRGFAGERVPTLEEVLSVLPQDVWINVQIKRGEPVARDVARTVLDSGRLHQVILSCGNQDARIAKAVHPRLRVCTLSRQRTRASYVEHAILIGAHFIQFHHLRGPMEPLLAARAHGAGIRVNFFCSSNPSAAELAALFEAGVDFVLVDDLERGLTAARRVGIEPLARAYEPAPAQVTVQPASGPV